jgi:inorganic pyrophosphatase
MQRMEWDALGTRDERSGAVNVIVDTPAGSRSKFKYDESRGLFQLNKLLPIGAAFPFDFGFIPGTRGEDGDALDALILGEEPTFTGCLVTVRVLGVIEAEQTGKGRTVRNDRMIVTPETEKIRPTARSLADVPKRVLTQIEHFFVSYNHAEGRVFKVLGRRGPRQAMELIERGVRLFRTQSRASS